MLDEFRFGFVKPLNVLLASFLLCSATGCGSPLAQSCSSLAKTMQEEEPDISTVRNLTEVNRVFVSTQQGEPLLTCKGDAVSTTGETVPFTVTYALTESNATGREYTTEWKFN
jgi:hypothetical protein